MLRDRQSGPRSLPVEWYSILYPRVTAGDRAQGPIKTCTVQLQAAAPQPPQAPGAGEGPGRHPPTAHRHRPAAGHTLRAKTKSKLSAPPSPFAPNHTKTLKMLVCGHVCGRMVLWIEMYSTIYLI